jgi:hypothetical protein
MRSSNFSLDFFGFGGGVRAVGSSPRGCGMCGITHPAQFLRQGCIPLPELNPFPLDDSQSNVRNTEPHLSIQRRSSTRSIDDEKDY